MTGVVCDCSICRHGGQCFQHKEFVGPPRQLSQDLLMACQVLGQWRSALVLLPQGRWPCPYCGRVDANAALRTVTVTQENGSVSIHGCWYCTNVDRLEAAAVALERYFAGDDE